jgi:hypothetical protein
MGVYLTPRSARRIRATMMRALKMAGLRMGLVGLWANRVRG